MTFPLASSVYRLADSEVLIAVAQTPEGPAPLFIDVGGEVACVAYTDLSEAQGDAQAADAREKLLVVYDVDGQTGADAQAADLIVDAARSIEYPRPLLVLALDDERQR